MRNAECGFEVWGRALACPRTVVTGFLQWFQTSYSQTSLDVPSPRRGEGGRRPDEGRRVRFAPSLYPLPDGERGSLQLVFLAYPSGAIRFPALDGQECPSYGPVVFFCENNHSQTCGS